MLETLARGFKAARDSLRGVGELSDENTAAALRDVRMSLLEADVDLGIARDFLARVQERCIGKQVSLRAGAGSARLRASPGDHFAKACYDELVALMGSAEPIAPARGTRALMLLGLQGSGKTSTAAKLALHLSQQGEHPLLVAADVRRPAAREQLQVLGEKIGVEVFTGSGDDALAICRDALAHAREKRLGTAILDTAGRLQIDAELMDELAQIADALEPELRLLVCDAMSGREAVHVAKGFAERVRLDGLVLTKLDGDARGGAALAIRSATGIPIRYVTLGETPERLEPFRAEGLASRILGMGDVVGLMRDFEQVADAEQAEREAERMLRGKFTFDDFLSQLRMLQKMGPLKGMLEKLPFAGELFPEGVNVDGNELRRVEAMILSMTPGERARPDLLDESRMRRVARGSGTRLEDLRELLGRFRTMRDLFEKLGKGGAGGLLGRVPGLGKLLGGGGPDLGGLDPRALGLGGLDGLGGAGNRHAARAQKAEARREKRKALRKHKRRGKRR